jgi:imidazole glycerol-phosphate synthase subunit HisH
MSAVIIIDSGGANLASLQFALQRLGATARVSSDAAEIAAAPRVLLPGVGAAADAMARLRERRLDDCVRQLRQPLLGICLGMQLLYTDLDEGGCGGLGLIEGKVQRLAAGALPVPHMGWNTCRTLRPDPLLAGLGADDYVYFVHSYAAPVSGASLAACDYGGEFTAVARRDNFWGVQFHPERSARVGARLLRNFLEL